MRKLKTIFFCLIFPGLLAGCAGSWGGFPSGVKAGYVWPPPPEQARVTHVMDIRQSSDLFEPAGFWTNFKRAFGGERDTRLVRPQAVALHPAGGLLVTDPGRKGVHFFCWGRCRYYFLELPDERPMTSPVGVAVLPDGRILVSDSRLGAIEAFDDEGEPLGEFCAADALQRPVGIVCSPERREVYVADALAHRIKVFDFKGNELRAFGEYGGGPGQFNFPTYLALNPDGNLIVMDSMNFRVQEITSEGEYISAFGHLGDAPGQLSKPKGVAVDDEGHIIAVEGLYSSLLFFNPDGAFLLHIGGPGSDPGQFWLPIGLCFDRKQKLLFVADGFNSRVQVFRMLEPEKKAK